MHGADNLNTPTFEETTLIGNVFHITKERLACQVKAEGNFTIDISAHDKTADSTRLHSKSSKGTFGKSNIKKRTKEEVQAIYKERGEARKDKEERQNNWQKHWEKEGDPKKSLGGGKRPKSFRTDHLDEDELKEKDEVKGQEKEKEEDNN